MTAHGRRGGRGVLVTALALAGPAHASAQGTLDGEWTATFATAGSDARAAAVVLRDGAGTWTTRAHPNRDKHDACVGRALPLTLVPGPSETVALHVHAGQAVAGCRDRRARLTIVDQRTLEGEFDDGRVLRLTRR